MNSRKRIHAELPSRSVSPNQATMESSSYYEARIAEVKADSELRAHELFERAMRGEIPCTQAWHSLPGPAADLQYPFLCRAYMQKLADGMAKEVDSGFAFVNADRIKAEGNLWLSLWEKYEKAVFEEREAFLQMMEAPVDHDAEVDAEARRRLADPKFDSEVRRRMKEIQAECADQELAAILQG